MRYLVILFEPKTKLVGPWTLFEKNLIILFRFDPSFDFKTFRSEHAPKQFFDDSYYM